VPGSLLIFPGSSKPLSLAIFSFAPWLGGEVYSAFDEKVPRGVSRPDRSERAMMANTYCQMILSVLFRKNKAAKVIPDIQWVTRSYLYCQVWPYYTRSRTRKPKPDDTVVHYPKGRIPAQNLSQATFSSFMANLRKVGCIEERQDDKNYKEKAYRITETGETSFRFYADPIANPDAKMVPGGS
jgi:hypothetical protein